MSEKHPPPPVVHAPYNFVPLSEWIFEPPHSDQVSRDYPLGEGIRGVLELELTTHSPLLVGGEQGRETEKEVRVPFFRLPNGDPAIPGSSIKGMIRNVLEIAAFGKMRLVDDKRYGLRDISGKHVAEVYRKSLFGSDPNNPHPLQAGFLRRGTDGDPVIVPCRHAKISHIDLEQWLGARDILFRRGMGVKEKYEAWKEQVARAGKEQLTLEALHAIRFDLGEMTSLDAKNPQSGATNLGQGDLLGALVFTGQVSDRGPEKNKRGKYKDFVFFNPDPDHPIKGEERLPPSVWQAFREIHGDDGRPLKLCDDPKKQEKSLAGQYPWMDHWKKRFYEGLPVPLFFRLDPAGRVMAMGLAYMFKRSCDYSVGQTIDHHDKYHRSAEKKDLVELIFGRIGAENTAHDSWKGRAGFGHFTRVKGSIEPFTWTPNTLLNGPKPTYFPNYLEQNVANGQLAGNHSQYSTFMDENARIRGWKRYPARPTEMVEVQPLLEDQKKNLKVQTTLETLPEGTRFRGHLRVHNLRPEELGALIWALEWGDRAHLRHSLGMGRPFGFGQVSLKIVGDFEKNLRPNRPDVKPGNKGFYRDLFVQWMETAYGKVHRGQRWAESPQLKNLLAMADPEQAKGRVLKHMVMGMKNRNDFVTVKQHGMVLPAYVETPATRSSAPSGVAKGKSSPGSDPESLSPWVDQTIQELAEKLKTSPAEVLRGKALAQRWQEMEDPELKKTALLEIKRRWDHEGLWTQPGKALKQARGIYQAGLEG
ncbi:MAG: TIGR03986 family CRISPR-associated RAMP protein [Magnetococcales bacterium]|nr:TIGR03986 family CRISPR-associated RAMP protein [Magnetococcales bacterium]